MVVFNKSQSFANTWMSQMSNPVLAIDGCTDTDKDMTMKATKSFPKLKTETLSEGEKIRFVSFRDCLEVRSKWSCRGLKTGGTIGNLYFISNI